MTYENLLKSIEENAQEKERELREKARRATDEIREGAQRKAKEIEASFLAQARREAEVEKNRQSYLTNAACKEQLIRIREAIYDQAFSQAGGRLSKMRGDPRYPVIFENLAREAIGAMGGKEVHVHVDRQDEKLCRQVMAELNVSGDIVPDLECAGGLVVSSPDETVRFENTFESRLDRAQDRKNLEIYTVLFGE
jgi:V/A-type H+-transporting ATPase subunit E